MLQAIKYRISYPSNRFLEKQKSKFCSMIISKHLIVSNICDHSFYILELLGYGRETDTSFHRINICVDSMFGIHNTFQLDNNPLAYTTNNSLKGGITLEAL